MSSIFFISEKNSVGYNAAGKAREDVSSILSLKYQGIGKIIKIDDTDSIRKKIKYNHIFLKSVYDSDIKNNDVLILQYPLPRGYNKSIIRLTKKYRCIFLVHDLEGIRYQNKKRIHQDIHYLKRAFKIISHNPLMTDYLITCGIDKTRVINLNLFDYLIDTKEEFVFNHFDDNAIMCFAGNLLKSNFLKKIGKDNIRYEMNVYGKPDNIILPNEICYCGSFDADIIPKMLRGKFGLVWDGDSCDTCSGCLGNYMRYNSPHKLSMYIAAGIPIVIWKEAAVAEFVIQNDIGIAVGTIKEAVEVIQAINRRRYNKIYENILKIRGKVIHGNILTDILRKIQQEIE